MIGWRTAWAEFATPVEKAMLAATRRIPQSTVDSVLRRAREAGYLVTLETKPARRKKARARGRRR